MKAPKKALKKLFPPGQSPYDKTASQKSKDVLAKASKTHTAALERLAKK